MGFQPEIKLQLIDEALKALKLEGKPNNLYAPLRYMIDLGGKRIRPLLVTMGCELFGGEAKLALPGALAVELFHNFSLIHDDLMDQSPTRRGQPTVYTKWNPTIAILSGDLMLVKAFEQLNQLPASIRDDCRSMFERTAIEVCEGQQLDMNFEQENTVLVSDYIEMITLKTAVLLGCSLYLGARCAGASIQHAQALYEVGKELGISFQLRDDYLDAFGSGDFGKRIGNDIIANKKTFLLLTALQLANPNDLALLNQWIQAENPNPEEKIRTVLSIFKTYQIDQLADDLALKHYQNAISLLDSLPIDTQSASDLKQLSASLLHRVV